MRALIISNVERSQAQALIDFASRPEHIYRPHLRPGFVAGSDPRHVLLLGVTGEFRCVFTVTDPEETPGVFYRHLSISVPGAFPNPAHVEEIARLFDFKGTFKDWIGGIHETEHCVVLDGEVTLGRKMVAGTPSRIAA